MQYGDKAFKHITTCSTARHIKKNTINVNTMNYNNKFNGIVYIEQYSKH